MCRWLFFPFMCSVPSYAKIFQAKILYVSLDFPPPWLSWLLPPSPLPSAPVSSDWQSPALCTESSENQAICVYDYSVLSVRAGRQQIHLGKCKSAKTPHFTFKANLRIFHTFIDPPLCPHLQQHMCALLSLYSATGHERKILSRFWVPLVVAFTVHWIPHEMDLNGPALSHAPPYLKVPSGNVVWGECWGFKAHLLLFP